MENYCSVSLLMQSFDAKTKEGLDGFEHKIVVEKFFDEENIQQSLKDIYDYYKEEPYLNAEGREIFWQVVKVLDVFEIIDSLPKDLENHTEVYSRFLSETGATQERILQRYFSDYVLEEEIEEKE